MRKFDSFKPEFDRAYQEHVAEFGKGNWPVLTRRFADRLPQPTMMRWIRDHQRNPAPNPDEIRRAAEITVNAVVAEVAAESPAAAVDSSAVIAKASQSIDFMSRLQMLYTDAEMLRAAAMKNASTVRNPRIFAESIRVRRDLLETALKALGQVYDLQRMQGFYDAILDEVGKVSPEIQRAVLERLAGLNDQAGLKISARV